MAVPTFSAEDFLSALQALMPRGRAWSQEPDSVQAQTLACFAPSYERGSVDALALIDHAFPATALDMLPEWEAALGLPDPCAGESPTLAGRRQQVVARLTNSGGQSVPYFIQLSAALGYTVSVAQDAPFRCGQSRAGDHLGDLDWFFSWSLHAPAETATPFRTGQATAGEPLNSWGNAVLECEITALAPAGTVVRFIYAD